MSEIVTALEEDQPTFDKDERDYRIAVLAGGGFVYATAKNIWNLSLRKNGIGISSEEVVMMLKEHCAGEMERLGYVVEEETGR